MITLDYLRQYWTENQSRGWKARCPEPDCQGKNLWYTPDNGRVYCFECGYTDRVEGTDSAEVFQVLEKLDIPSIRSFYATYMEQAAEIDTTLRTYLCGRGFQEDWITRYGIKHTPSTLSCLSSLPVTLQRHSGVYESGVVVKTRKASTTNLLQNRVLFPYYHGEEITDIRGRALEKEQEPRYQSPQKTARARGAWYPYNVNCLRTTTKDYFVITEGEIKSIFSTEIAQIPTVGLPGMLAWRHGLLEYSQGKTPIIVFDNDAEKLPEPAIDRVATRFEDAYVVVLPLLGEEKMDIDTFLLHPQGGIREYVWRIETALPYRAFKRLRNW